VLYPVLSDMSQVEKGLNALLEARNVSGSVYEADEGGSNQLFGVILAFVGLLFAILASGCQYSRMSSSEKEATAHLYG
jgi:hypothetical protein